MVNANDPETTRSCLTHVFGIKTASGIQFERALLREKKICSADSNCDVVPVSWHRPLT